MTQANQILQCQETVSHKKKKCNRLIGWGADRRGCKEAASLGKARVAELTKSYNNTMDNVIEKCADRELTDEALKQCKKDIALATQEFVANCNAAMEGVVASFGQKTVQKRFGRVKEALVNVRRKLSPRLKQREEARELKQGYKDWLKNWQKTCEAIPTLQKAQGMDSVTIGCKELRDVADEKLDHYAGLMVSGSILTNS